MCLIKAGRTSPEDFLIHSPLNPSSMLTRKERCVFSFLCPKGTFLDALFFSINLINDHLNPRKKFLKMNHNKSMHLDILFS